MERMITLVKYQYNDNNPSLEIKVVCHGDGLFFGNVSHRTIARTLL
jgi:hypothetical protein